MRISVRQVDGSDQHTLYRRTRYSVPGDPGGFQSSKLDRVSTGSQSHAQDRYAVPGTFTQPDSAIKPSVTKGTCRKCSLLYFEEPPEADDDQTARLRATPWSIRQTFVDVVDVESGDLQWSGPHAKRPFILTRVSHCGNFVCAGRVLRMKLRKRRFCHGTQSEIDRKNAVSFSVPDRTPKL